MARLVTLSNQVWAETSPDSCCPVCGRDHFCLVSTDSRDVVCTKEESPIPFGDSGWVWKDVAPNQAAVGEQDAAPRPVVDWSEYLQASRVAMTPERVGALIEDIGTEEYLMDQMLIGYDTERDAYSFPMRDGMGKTVGVRLRNRQGQKWAVAGSQNGLFIGGATAESQVLIPEGPTNTLALAELGFEVWGRASCNHGKDMLLQRCRFLEMHGEKPKELVFMADLDAPSKTEVAKAKREGRDPIGAGEFWAYKQARWFAARGYTCRVVLPHRGQDPRDWVDWCGSRDQIQAVINSREAVAREP